LRRPQSINRLRPRKALTIDLNARERGHLILGRCSSVSPTRSNRSSKRFSLEPAHNSGRDRSADREAVGRPQLFSNYRYSGESRMDRLFLTPITGTLFAPDSTMAGCLPHHHTVGRNRRGGEESPDGGREAVSWVPTNIVQKACLAVADCPFGGFIPGDVVQLARRVTFRRR
jgi:hypothetical protein